MTLFFAGGFMISTVNKLEFQRYMYVYVIRVNKAWLRGYIEKNNSVRYT